MELPDGITVQVGILFTFSCKKTVPKKSFRAVAISLFPLIVFPATFRGPTLALDFVLLFI